MGVNKPKYYYLLNEDGSKIELEDGSGYILLEDQVIGCRVSPWMSGPLMFLIFLLGQYLNVKC